MGQPAIDDDNLITQQEALGARLARRWIDFGRLLRRNGVQTTAAQMRDLLSILPLLGMSDRDTVYYASRSLLVSRREDLAGFDITFRQFWGRTRQMIIPSDSGSLQEKSEPRSDKTLSRGDEPKRENVLPVIERATLGDSADSEPGPPADDEELARALLYSSQERLRTLDFSRFTEEEISLARALLASWRWQPGERRTRRLAAKKRGHKLDFPRTLRRAMRTSGVPFSLSHMGPRQKPRRLVLLCDISGSMAPYTRMMLFFLHTLYRGVTGAEVFVFGTRLTRITRQLRVRDVDQALEDVGKSVHDWSGGTRIGASLRDFNTHWARRVLGQGAVVCVISDGWDRGDPAELAAELSYLQRMSFRLIWLNPLLGVSGYRPLTRGMAAALPYIDNFLPAHNLASLQALAVLLSSVELQTRPSRRQLPRLATKPSVLDNGKATLARQVGNVKRDA